MSGPLLVDDRAGSRDLIEWPPLDKIGSLVTLDAGDVWIMGNGPDGDVDVGVEVKSVWDLISSMQTGRLQATQIPGMLREFDVSWLLVYGDYRPSPRDGRLQLRKSDWRAMSIGKRPVPYGYVEAMLFDLAAMGVQTKRVADPREAAYWIGCLHRWWSKPWEKHAGMRTLDRSQDPGLMPGMTASMQLRVKVASQLPGVGFERATAAAEHFGSVRRMIMGHRSDWISVPGIGPVIADAVIEAVREEE